jgi:hypothetical protein
MKLSYRVTAAAALAIPIFFAIEDYVIRAAARSDGAVAWEDCCSSRGQIPTGVPYATVFFFAALLYLVIQGLRNRRAPIWIPISCLIAFAITINHDRWRFDCYSPAQRVYFVIDSAAFVVMCLHQVVRRA